MALQLGISRPHAVASFRREPIFIYHELPEHHSIIFHFPGIHHAMFVLGFQKSESCRQCPVSTVIYGSLTGDSRPRAEAPLST